MRAVTTYTAPMKKKQLRAVMRDTTTPTLSDPTAQVIPLRVSIKADIVALFCTIVS